LVHNKLDLLSAQERRVVALVAEGKTNKEIGHAMALSDKTVKNYLSNALEKLQVARRSQAAALFIAQTRETTNRFEP
jgi:two-component system response regulator DevR